MENFSPSEHRKNFSASVRLWLCVFVIALALPLALRAQDTGYISGTVTDKSGAAIAGAEVVITNTTGSLTRTTTTNTDGAYVVPGLAGDTYNISVTAKGFQKYQARNVKLDVAQKTRIDVTLTVGVVTEVVEVTGESVAQVETESSALGSTITGKQVDQLILNGRNFTQLVTLSPGVISQTGTDEGKVGVYGNVAYSMNGGRTEYNNWELDGGDNMDNGSNATLNVYPNPEAIAEFKVLTSNYGAQYGRNGSGTVEVETKSGGNSFHGSAFEYLRNDFFNAKSWAEGADPTAKKASYKKHDYGYTIGGPVFIPNHFNADKRKTFFFFSEEWRKESNTSSAPPGAPTTPNVPSDAERTGDFTDVCPSIDCPHDPVTGNPFPGNKITPTATGAALLALIPKANTVNGVYPGTTIPLPAFQQTVSTPTKWREELVRLDHNLTDNYRLTFRYIHDSWQTVVPDPLWGNGTTTFQNVTTTFVGPGSSFVARMNANISPTLLNEFVASYTADHIFLTTGGPVALPSGFSMGSIFNNGFGGKLPAINIGADPVYGGGFGQDSGYFPWHNANPTYTYRDNMTKVFRTHTFQFGAYLVFAQKNEANSPNVQGILTFSNGNGTVTSGNSFADLLLGNISSYQQWSKETQYYDRYKIVEPYFQDDWRVTKRLTLNLGLRVSLFGTYRERYKQAFNFEPSAFVNANEPAFNPADGSLMQNAGNTANPLNGFIQCGGAGGSFPLVPGSAFPNVTVGSSPNAGCLSGHLFNPAPRIGFAFDPKGNGRMAIRGGYGIFYEHTNGNEGNTESLEGSAPLVLSATQSNVRVGLNGCPAGPNGGYACIGAQGGVIPFFPLSVVSIPNKAVWPYVQQWNLNVQKELPSHVVLSVAYVGSKGTHLTLLNNANQLQPLPSSQNPFGKSETLYNTGTPGPIDPVTKQPIPDGACAGPNQVPGQPVDPTLTQPWAPGQTVVGTNGPLNVQAATLLNVACGLVPNGVNTVRTAFPAYGNISTLRDAADSIYHSLQVTANRTIGDLTLSMAYTYSHSIDDSSDRAADVFVNAFDLHNNRASSNFDMRHNLAISYVYGLPFFKGSGVAHSVLGGWQLAGITVAQTGNPFTVSNGTSQGDNAGVGNGVATAGSRPDLVGNPHSAPAPDGLRGPLAYNPAAFAAPQGLTFGDVGRNTLNLPGRVNFDFGVLKKFPINEKAGFEFRWQSFNLFNHTQFNAINSGLGPATFLHLTNTHDGRRMQLGLRFYF